MGRAYTQIATASDYALRIAPLRLELAPGRVIQTFAYNDRVPGPVLRLREGRQVSIDIRNDSDIDDIVHWHGLYLPSQADGAMEEGSPMVERGGTRRYTFTAKPTGTRWYHSHNIAGTDLRRSLYGGLYGFLIVEPASDPGRYDQEVLLATHHWEGSWVSMQDIRRGPPPDNGLEVLYASASFNDKIRIFPRLTRPTSLPPSTIGTRLIRLRSSIAAISPRGVSGFAVMTSRVITSATMREYDLIYSVADAHLFDISSSHQECRLAVPISGRRIKSPSLTMPTRSPFSSTTGAALM
jgi:hypothetical protein